MKLTLNKIFTIGLSLFGMSGAFAGEGDAWSWPEYSPTIYYNFKDQGIVYEMPTKNLTGSCYNSATGHTDKDWWTFIWGANKNSLVSDEAIENMLIRFNTDFNYITDTLGWPRDRRAQEGYRSAVYLYGSMSCTGSNDPTELGGWQSTIDGYPCVAASYYPVYSFDSKCTYNDRQSQMSAMIHEGIHCILTDLGAKHVHWFQEGGNTWLQQEMEVRRSNSDQYVGMGFLNAVDLIAPFIPIECYSGWLLDGSFGGPGAEGVGAGTDASGNTICNWRTTLGGVQYGNLFPTFLGVWISEGAVPWIWVNTTNTSKYILETMSGSMGDAQTRRLIMEYRAKLALCDMKKWSWEMRNLLNSNVGGSIGREFTPCVAEVESWKVTPYVVTTNENGVLTPENRTTPGWSGANVIPLTVSGDAVKVELQPIGDNMSLQLCYRATDGNPIYSEPIMGADTAVLKLEKTPQDNVVFAVVCNTDYAYKGEETRKKHHDYRLKLIEGVSAAADPYKKWYDNFVLEYDWESVSHTTTSDTSVKKLTVVDELVYDVNLPLALNYEPTKVSVDALKIGTALDLSAASLSNLLGESVYFYGQNSNGSLYKTSTANDPGHWFNASGNVVSFGTDCVLYSEFDAASMGVNIGHSPNAVKVGDTYTIRQAIVSGDKQVSLIFNVKIVSSDPTSTPETVSESVFSEPLTLYYDRKVIVADYVVPFDAKVTLSLYTAYGALITHLVKDWLPAGSYKYGIDLESMGLPEGIYLIKLSYPGVQQTKVSILNPR